MIEIRKTNNINQLKNDWQKIYDNNTSLVNNASFEFVKTFVCTFKSRLKSLLKPASRPVFYYFVEDGKTIMILPANIKNNEIHSLYTLDYFDIPADKEIDGKKILDCLTLLAKQENKPVYIERLNKKYSTYNKMNGLVEFLPHTPCVEINFNENYDDYYNSLSKHARQNLRTAYNRAKTDNYEITFATYNGQLDTKLAKKLQKIYLNRRVGKYKNMNFIKKMLFSISDPIKNVCFNRDDNFTSVISFNNQPVAFMSGLIKNREVMVPRLAIDEKYSRYSVGIILVNETIKNMIEKNFNCLDLANGTENYKYQMGGGDCLTVQYVVGVQDEKNKANN